ncbi:MAG TPA: response regulator transcription factor [Pyrinomonadaceae bacterium]|nr:response regulator transcription factor [Pyrinomonadaceae bacterium]
MNILIAEDDPVSRRVLEATLQKWDYKVTVVHNGADAWEVMQGQEPASLAILDIMMPGMDGLEVCRRVRTIETSTPPYLILLTAMSSKSDVVKGIEAGANDYLSKPFHRDELRVRVNVGVQMLELQKSLANRVSQLEEALSQVKQLQGMLPICSYCKKIRNDENYWEGVETYISDHSHVEFSHGICPDCHTRVMDELAALRSKRHGAEDLVLA